MNSRGMHLQRSGSLLRIVTGSYAIVAVLASGIMCEPADSSTARTRQIRTKSGLSYEEIKEGAGRETKAGDMVQIHYTCRLVDGKEVDSSVDRGVPFRFRLGGGHVIKGLEEGLTGMKVGGMRRLCIPSNLGYGTEGRPPVIPPNAELIFEVELVESKQ